MLVTIGRVLNVGKAGRLPVRHSVLPGGRSAGRRLAVGVR
jgi:hypothetical protein